MSDIKGKKYTEVISNKRIVFFSLIAPVAGLLSAMWGNLQFYSASALYIPQTIIAVVFLVYSIVDSINDPIIGYLTDRSSKFTSKFGKRYLWIVIGVLLSPVFLLFCYFPISNNVIVMSIWLIIFMAIYETFLTLHEVSQKSLFPDMFREQENRRKVSVIGGIIGGITLILGALFIPIMIEIWGGANSQPAYLITMIIIIAICYLLTVPYLKGVKETEEMKSFRTELDQKGKSTSSVKEVITRIFKDKSWMGLVIAYLLYAIAGLCVINGINFFVVYNLELPIALASIPGVIHSVVAIILAPIWISIAKKLGVKKTFMTSLFLNSLAFLLFFFVSDLVGMSLVFAFIGVGSSANLGVIFDLVQAEGIDNAAVNSGKREEGTYIGILRVFSAFSLFFQTLIFALVSSISGFDAAMGTNQTDLAKLGLNIQMSLIPFTLAVIGAILFTLIYKISKEKAKENASKLVEMGL